MASNSVTCPLKPRPCASVTPRAQSPCGAIFALVLIICTLWWLCSKLAPSPSSVWVARASAQVRRALRYALADTDFVIRRGVLNRSLTLVPYGRIQYVDIYQPVLRLLGISTTGSTASAKTDATLSGVPGRTRPSGVIWRSVVRRS